MNLDLLKGQTKQIEYLKKSREKSRLTHAYIFEGKKGVGKNELAHYFAALLYSNTNDLDMKSNTSRLIFNDEFLNLYTIYHKDSNVIKKEDIESLKEELSRTSLIKGPRVYIINDADTLNLSSANSLLKFIEEPRDDIYAILCTTNAKKIIPTIISRCQILRLNEINPNIVRISLIEKGIDRETSALLSLLTYDVKSAIELSNDTNTIKLFDYFKDFFNLKSEIDKVRYFEELNKNFSFNRNYIKSYVSLLILTFEDLLYLYQGIYDINLEIYIEKIEKLKDEFSYEDTIIKLEYLYKISSMLSDTNVLTTFVIENLSLNLM